MLVKWVFGIGLGWRICLVSLRFPYRLNLKLQNTAVSWYGLFRGCGGFRLRFLLLHLRL